MRNSKLNLSKLQMNGKLKQREEKLIKNLKLLLIINFLQEAEEAEDFFDFVFLFSN